jgi:hypothetical protein
VIDGQIYLPDVNALRSRSEYQSRLAAGENLISPLLEESTVDPVLLADFISAYQNEEAGELILYVYSNWDVSCYALATARAERVSNTGWLTCLGSDERVGALGCVGDRDLECSAPASCCCGHWQALGDGNRQRPAGLSYNGIWLRRWRGITAPTRGRSSGPAARGVDDGEKSSDYQHRCLLL